MIKHYIVMALRNIKRSPLFSLINILGFTLGIAASLLIYSWVRDELTADKFHADYQNIYRVTTLNKEDGSFISKVSVAATLPGNLVKDFPQIVDGTFINHFGSKSSFLYKDELLELNEVGTGSNFFQFFSFPALSGSAADYKSIPNAAVLSEKAALKLFGSGNAVGEVLVWRSHFIDIQIPFRVVAVVQIPHASHIQFDIAMNMEYYMRQVGSYEAYFGTGKRTVKESYAYIKTDSKNSFTHESRKKLFNYLSDSFGSKEKLQFVSLKDIHFDTETNAYYDAPKGNAVTIVVFSLLAVVILLMAAFNFMVLTTAQSMQRNVEVGVRKSSGSVREQLVSQFFLEAIVQIAVALVLAFMVARISLPWINGITGRSLVISLDFSTIIAVATASIVMGLIATSYPSMYLSSLSSVEAIRGGIKLSAKNRFVQAVVIVQFAASIVLIVFSLAINRQMSFIRNFDFGLNKENVVTLNTNLWYDVDKYKAEILKHPGVEAVSMTFNAPNDFSYSLDDDYGWDGVSDLKAKGITVAYVDGDFDKVYQIKMVQGEFFKYTQDKYWSGEYSNLGNPIMINEKAQKALGLENPIGHRLGTFVITGVVKDFHFKSLNHPITPLIFRYNPEALTSINIRINGHNKKEVLSYLKEVYQKHRPTGVFSYQFFDDKVALQYKATEQEGRVFMSIAFISILIASLGVLGLASFSAQRRTKEIGIRKVNGATTRDVIILLSKGYAANLLIAGALAIPISVILLNRWMSSFAYHVRLGWWIWLLAMVVVFVVAIASVTLITYRAAKRNPVDSLRYE